MKRRIFKNKAELIASAIAESDRVLDVGFWGQGIQKDDPSWPHTLLKQQTKEVYGVDIEIDTTEFSDTTHYLKASAEDFSFTGTTFDAIFAGDLIEHLSNPGLFLNACHRHLSSGGRLIITTPNCFNLFNIAEKFTKDEPTVNSDHTFYFNHKVLHRLLEKNGFALDEISYVYSLEYTHKESLKKKILNMFYRLFSWCTPKFIETLVIVARPL
jgi:2-polyprenyl-3-methyl-5-hydroxy-6-metoxy-1,4-benzoquinol methylase